jgi:hypothetical protein
MSFLVPILGGAAASYGIEQLGKAIGIGGLPPRLPGKQRAVARKCGPPKRRGACGGGKKKKTAKTAGHRKARRKK